MKLCSRVVTLADWQHFPDSRIGASLKPAIFAGRRGIPRLLPRFANRGLIEASVKVDPPV